MKLMELACKRKTKHYRKFIAKVDDEDFEWLSQWDWHFSGHYAVRAEYKGKKTIRFFMHREIMKQHGLLKESKSIDHKDRDGLNNQKYNLRECTHAQNMSNRGAFGSSKYLGVSLHTVKRYRKHTGGMKTYSYWIATFGGNGKWKHLGIFKKETEAALAYNEAAKICYGEFANLNQIN